MSNVVNLDRWKRKKEVEASIATHPNYDAFPDFFDDRVRRDRLRKAINRALLELKHGAN